MTARGFFVVVFLSGCVLFAMAVGGMWWESRWQTKYLALVDQRTKDHQEEIRRNNELMIQESLHCARSGGVPVRVDVMHAAPHIHCAR